jgi:cytochrome c oxidase cbb3-type subunit 3
MCSRFRKVELAVLCAALAACSRHTETASQPLPPNPVQGTAMPTLYPAAGNTPPSNATAATYAGDDTAKSQGAQLFDKYNCSGCHFHGAGGIGPSLMDNQWIYGGSMEQIYSSIYQGRPNGMPSWGQKLSSTDIWKITAYVNSLPSSNPAGAKSLPNPPLPPVPAGEAKEPGAPSPAVTASTEK